MGGAGEGVASEDMMKIQYEMLHMFGAVMAGSKVIPCISLRIAGIV